MKKKWLAAVMGLCWGSMALGVGCNESDSAAGSEAPAHEHLFTWVQAEETHERRCACGERENSGAHEYGEGKECSVCSAILVGTEGLEYTLVTENGEEVYAVTGIGTATDAQIIIPSTYNGKRVTSIARNAFRSNKRLANVVLPENVAKIEYQAFSRCWNLTSVTLCGGMPTIEGFAFSGCPKLVEIVNKSALPLEVGDSGYGLIANYAKQVVLKEEDSKIMRLDDYLFYAEEEKWLLLAYTGEEEIISLPSAIEGASYEVADYAFYYSEVRNVRFSEGVTAIGDFAFENSKLSSVVLPKNVSKMGRYAFYGSSQLREFEFLDPVGWKADGVSMNETIISNTETAAEYMTQSIKQNGSSYDYYAAVWEKAAE